MHSDIGGAVAAHIILLAAASSPRAGQADRRAHTQPFSNDDGSGGGLSLLQQLRLQRHPRAPQLEETPETPPSSRAEGLLFLHGLETKGLSRVFSNTTVQKHQFFDTQLSL